MERYGFITKLALIVLCVLLTGCTEDVPKKFTEGDIPPPPSLKIVSSSVKDDLEIRSDQPITITFSNVMDSVNIGITGVKGNTNLDYSNTSATFNPFAEISDGIYTLKVTGKDEYDQEIQQTITFTIKNGATPPPPSSMIVYTSNLDGDYEIYLIKTDGSDMAQLTSNAAQDTQPVWSPNGKYIIFASDRDGAFMWNSDIFIIRADGSAQINLTKTQGINEFNPCWSFDGKKILYQTDMYGFNEYYVMGIDGTNQRPMEDAEYFDFAYPPVFGDNALISDNSNGNYEIYMDSLTGGDLINLTNHLANDTFPAWSPDGHKIVFVSDRDFNNEIYIMDADGSNQRRVTRNFVDDSQPCWSPF